MASTLQLADDAKPESARFRICFTIRDDAWFCYSRQNAADCYRFWLRIDGFAADEILAQHCVIAELPSLRHLTFIISLGNTETDIDWCTLAKRFGHGDMWTTCRHAED